MPTSKTLTAANSVILLTIPGLYNVPQQLQGFATDEVADTDAIESAEVMMGVDGIMSAGWVPKEIKQTITLQADSDSIALFETWYAAQQSVRELYYATQSNYLPSVRRKYQLNKGVLTSYSPTPSVKKMLQPRKFTITFGSISSGGL